METTIKRKLTSIQMLNLFGNPDKIYIKFYERIGNIENLQDKGFYKITIRHAENKKAEDIFKNAMRKP